MSETLATDLTFKLLELTNNYSFFKREHEAVVVGIDGEQRSARLVMDSVTSSRWKVHVLPGSKLHGDSAFTGELDVSPSSVYSIDYTAYMSHSKAADTIERLGLVFDAGARFVEYPREIRMLSEGAKFTYRMHCFFGEAYRACALSIVDNDTKAAIDKLYRGWHVYHELMIVKNYPAWWPQESRS